MKKLFIFIFALFCSLATYSQMDASLHTLEITKIKHKNNYVAAKQLITLLGNTLGQSYNIKSHSSIVIKPKINTGKAHLIEGMDIKAAGKPELKFTIRDKTRKIDTSYVYVKELSAATPTKLGEKLVQTFSEDAQAKAELLEVINAFFAINYADGCAAHFEKVATLREKKEYHKALVILANMVAVSSCSEKAVQMQDEIIADIDQEACDNKMHKATILVNSNSAYEMKQAIRILLTISPTAPCAQEALNLSKQIGEKMKGKDKIMAKVNQYQQFYTQQGNDKWRAYYMNKVMSH